MNGKAKVFDIFKTTAGTIAILAFENSNVPYFGMLLHDNSQNIWKIIGLAIGAKDNQIKATVEGFASVWDCNLEPINHFNPIPIDWLYHT
jgi:hypothetical protein